MARAFEQVIELQLRRHSPEEARRRHIARARQGLSDWLARQQHKPQIAIEVDGRPAASEDAVRPWGVIVYRFTRLREVVMFALEEARRLSPVRSGRYRDSWFCMVDGREASPAAITGAKPVIVTNDQPYSRKINVGAKGFEKYVPPGIVEKVRQLAFKKFGATVDIKVQYITLRGAYRLKADQFRRNKLGQRVGHARRDARKGMQVTYPALLIEAKRFA